MSRLPRFCLLCAVAVLSCHKSSVGPAAGALRLSPAALDFGDVAVAASVDLPLAIANDAPYARTVVVTAPAPFSVSQTLTIGGGSSTNVVVTFRPTQPGPQQARVTATTEDIALSADLKGNGLPACAPSHACVSSSFDTGTRACIEAPVADGTSCINACLTDATCRAGACLGGAPTATTAIRAPSMPAAPTVSASTRPCSAR
jgi:hypothetical protein